MTNITGYIMRVYCSIMEVFFYVFLFGTLSFGRAFSTYHIVTPFGPLFITEIFILLNMPMLLLRYKKIPRLPGLFLKFLLGFFIFGCCLLLGGIISRNMLALRDVTLCGYILFLPIVLIYLNNPKRVGLLVAVILLSNVVGLYSGLCIVMNVYPSEAFYHFLYKSKIINLGLYCGMASMLIISFYGYIKPRICRFLALALLSVNLYLIIAICKKSLWVAALIAVVFLLLMLKNKFLKLLFFLAPVFIVTNLIIFCFNSVVVSSSPWQQVLSEIKGMELLFKGKPSVNPSVEMMDRTVRPDIELVRAEAVKSETMLTKDYIENKVHISGARPGAEPVNPSAGSNIKPIREEAAKYGAVPAIETWPGAGTIDPAVEAETSRSNILWRISIWKQTLKFAVDSPLIGKGFGVYPVYDIYGTRQYPEGIYLDSRAVPAHNHLITVFLKMGILGVALFLFINGYVFFHGMRYVNRCNRVFMKYLLVAFLGAFLYWHMFALFFDAIDSPPTSIFLWIIMAIIFVAIEIDRNSIGGHSEKSASYGD